MKQRSAFYKKIQQEANRLLHKYIQAKLIQKASGRCKDCGEKRHQYLCYDHRDYSEALSVEVVCHSCNALRGTAWIPFLELGSLQLIRYKETALELKKSRRAA